MLFSKNLYVKMTFMEITKMILQQISDISKLQLKITNLTSQRSDYIFQLKQCGLKPSGICNVNCVS